MDDLISRQAMIDAVKKELNKTDQSDAEKTLNLFYWQVFICSVPSAEPRWIPVTERLPKYGNYLVSFRTNEEIDIGTYDPKTGLWSACDADGMYYVESKGLEVIAWTPLPESYRGEK